MVRETTSILSMKKNMIRLLAFILLFNAKLLFAQDHPHHQQLLKVYDEAYHGYMKKDIRLIEASIANSTLQALKDTLKASGKKYPQDFFQNRMELPSLSRFKYFKTILKGTTASMVYFMHQHKKQEYTGVFIIKYLEENRKWKMVETIREENEELALKINRRDYSFLKSLGL
jgi:hypothetical protein